MSRRKNSLNLSSLKLPSSLSGSTHIFWKSNSYNANSDLDISPCGAFTSFRPSSFNSAQSLPLPKSKNYMNWFLEQTSDSWIMSRPSMPVPPSPARDRHNASTRSFSISQRSCRNFGPCIGQADWEVDSLGVCWGRWRKWRAKQRAYSGEQASRAALVTSSSFSNFWGNWWIIATSRLNGQKTNPKSKSYSMLIAKITSWSSRETYWPCLIDCSMNFSFPGKRPRGIG